MKSVPIPTHANDFSERFVEEIVIRYLVFKAKEQSACEAASGQSLADTTPPTPYASNLGKPKVEIISWDAVKAAQDGENFCSYLVRLAAEFSYKWEIPINGSSADVDEGTTQCAPSEHCKASFIVKLLPPNAAHRETVLTGELFEKEVEYYSRLIPGLQQIADDAGFSPNRSPRNLFPDCYWASANQEDGYVLVLEDLCSSGFKPLNPRTQPVGEKNCFQVLTRLAELHALSFALSRKLGGEPAVKVEYPYVCTSFPFASDAFMVALIQGALGTVTMLRQLPDQEELADLFEEYVERNDLGQRLRDSFELSWKKLGCISHGDMWSSNIFIRDQCRHRKRPSVTSTTRVVSLEPKTNAEKNPERTIASQTESIPAISPEDIRLIDFQFSRWGHPAVDLAYFRATSLQPEFWSSQMNREAVFTRYLESFFEATDLLGLDLEKDSFYTVNDLKEDYRKAAEGSFLVAIVLLPSILASSTDKLDMDDFNLEKIIQTRERQIQSGRVDAIRDHLVPLVREMKDLGIIG